MAPQPLIDAGHLPPGDVDDRDIKEVQPDDLKGYGQVHLFCGIGGFPLGLRMAGWPDDRPIWTGGYPCQDASNAIAIWGRRTGLAGERTGLAFVMLDLIAALRPHDVVFENVPGLESEAPQIEDRLAVAGYGVSRRHPKASDVGAPHKRRRLFIVANRGGKGLEVAWPRRSPEVDGGAWGTIAGDIWQEYHASGRRMDDGVPARVAKLRAFGNAVVPQVVTEIARSIIEADGVT